MACLQAFYPVKQQVCVCFLTIIFVKCLQNQTWFQMNLFKFEEIESGFIRQAKHRQNTKEAQDSLKTIW